MPSLNEGSGSSRSELGKPSSSSSLSCVLQRGERVPSKLLAASSVLGPLSALGSLAHVVDRFLCNTSVMGC